MMAAAFSCDATAAPPASRPTGQIRSMQIEVSKGGLIRLDSPAAAVFIADPEICDVQVKSPSLIYLMGRKPGETTLYAVDENERLLEAVNISVVHNLSRLRDAVRSLHPDVQIGVSSIGNAVLLKGRVPTAAVADDVRRLASTVVDKQGEVINKLAVTAPTQVNLRVRVAEVDRSIRKELGVRWDVAGQIGSFEFGFLTRNFLPEVGFLPNVISGGAVTDKWDVNALIDVLAQEGLVSVLAEPNLIAQSGENASFLAGGEFPILIPQGNGAIGIEFKKFGVSLNFTPTILSQDRISLAVKPEVSELTDEGAVNIRVAIDQSITVPALRVRRAETTVELGSGQSFAIAGLLRNTSDAQVRRLPGLGDIPIIGALFRSDRFRSGQSELVIIITPYVVRPVPANTLAAPTDGLSPPSDGDRIYYGGTYRRAPEAGPGSVVTPGGRRSLGGAGFMLE